MIPAVNSGALPAGFQFSQGSLQDFRDCPRRFELKYVEQRAWPALISEPAMAVERRMLLGAAFHRLVQQHLAGLTPGQVEAALIDPFGPADGEELLEWWHAYLAARPAELPGQRFVEYPLAARLAGQRIVAKLDLLVIQKSPTEPASTRAVILDWKTSRQIKREFLAASLQTRVYRCLTACCAVALNGGVRIPPQNIEMVYWFTEPGASPVRFDYNEDLYREDQKFLGGLMTEIACIPAGSFLHTTNLKACERCVYRSLCGRGIRAASLEEENYEQEESAPVTLETGITVPSTKIRLQKFPVWKFAQSEPVDRGVLEAAGGDDLIAQMLTRQGLRTREEAAAFLNPDLYNPASPWEMPGMEKLVSRLQTALEGGETICVWGDFDVDGQTSTTILVDTLRRLGGDVRYHIPVRETEGHGVNLPGLEKIIDAGAKVVITCDTGITAYEAAAYARIRGVDLLISDHHVPGPTLPDVFAIVNPHFLPEGHPLAGLPGVGVAWQIANALATTLGKPEIADDQLDLAALGIVADVAEQRGDTRWLLQRGLASLRRTGRPGLIALCESASVNPANVTEETIGFMLGPRLNAIGRLADANQIVEFLTTGDRTQAAVIASELEALNSKRRLLVEQVFLAARAQVESDPMHSKGSALVLAHPAWPAGVVGIAASRLVDFYNRPTVLLCTPAREDAHGSARSIRGVDINQAISTCSSLLTGFGGHPMAAGLALNPNNIDDFRHKLCRAIEEQTGGSLPEKELILERELPLEAAVLDLVDKIECLAPFGQGNPGPVFSSNGVRVESATLMGKAREHLQIFIRSSTGISARAVWWGGAELASSFNDGLYEVAYRLRSQDYQGTRQVQIEWVDARQLSTQTPIQSARRGPKLINLRKCLHPRQELETRLAERPQIQVWREGMPEPSGINRRGLIPGPILCLWSIPPGPEELDTAIQAVSPEEILVFGIPVDLDTPEVFLQYLLNLLTRTKDPVVSVFDPADLAADTGQRLVAVHLGLACLHARGTLTVSSLDTGLIRIEPGGQPAPAEDAERRLAAILEETAAFRKLFRLLPLESLIQIPEKPPSTRAHRR